MRPRCRAAAAAAARPKLDCRLGSALSGAGLSGAARLGTQLHIGTLCVTVSNDISCHAMPHHFIIPWAAA